MAINIDKALIEEACKGIIETILYCLPNSFKGTAYLIGPPPDLRAVRVTSGIISPDRTVISWGLPQVSDYNPPGKGWMEYRDEPNRPLEAMAWCVERQKSWTAEDPVRDSRSVNLQLDGTPEDCHHMEPVLVRKSDLYPNGNSNLEYPKNYQGETIWRDTDHVVVAVIKIHFRPYTIRIGSAETKVIKKLSRILGTELLSYQIRQQAMDAFRELAEQRLNTCNLLAHTIRNAITKSGLILSLIKLELGFLRMQWEELITDGGRLAPTITSIANELETRLLALSLRLSKFQGHFEKIILSLRRLKSYFINPNSVLEWIDSQVTKKWEELVELAGPEIEEGELVNINELILLLKRAAKVHRDPELYQLAVSQIPQELKERFTQFIYSNNVASFSMDELLEVLETDQLPLPFMEKSRRSLIHLNALLEVIRDLEITSNRAIADVKGGVTYT